MTKKAKPKKAYGVFWANRLLFRSSAVPIYWIEFVAEEEAKYCREHGWKSAVVRPVLVTDISP